MKKQRIDIVVSEETLKNLSSFVELEEMNKTVRIYKDIIKESISRKDAQSNLIKLIELLKRHSCKYLGVSFLCKNSIADKMGVSYKTVQRMTKKLEELGMVKQLPMKRKKDMQQTSNAIIIIPFVEEKKDKSDKNSQETIENCPTKTNSISLKQKINNINKRNNISEQVSKDSSPSTIKVEEVEMDHTFVSSNIPVNFINTVRPFFNKAKDIVKLWSKLKLAIKNSNVDLTVEDNLNDFIKTFKEAIFRLKQGKVKKDFFGFIYGAWKNAINNIVRTQNMEMHAKLVDFYLN